MGEILRTILDALQEPADALLDPGKRVFWPFLAGSALLAVAVLVARGVGGARAVRGLLAQRIWLHRSALGDYQLILVKALLRVALFGAFGVSTLAVAAMVAGALRRHAGLPELAVSPLVVGALFTLAAFLVEDWSRFALHRWMHRSPLLWQFHKVHHSAEVLTPFTLYRTHPVEALLNGVRSATAIGLVTGVSAWLFGPRMHAWEILGVDAIGFLWTIGGANLRHSHVWVSYGRWLEHLLVSPAQHQIHHSSDVRHVDRNFGTVLAVWDWLGGSLYVPRVRETLRFGLPDESGGHGMLQLLGAPLIGAARQLAQTLTGPSLVGSRLGFFAIVAGAALLSSGCTPAKKLDRTALLKSFGECTVGAYTKFKTAADDLVVATSTYAATPDDSSRAAVRVAWEKAIDAWEVAELLRFGPAAGFDTIGGQGIRENIYAWPDVNRCLIEQQIVSKAYEGDQLAALSTSTRGLGAVEYLLFYGGPDNACDPMNAMNTSGAWTALSSEELTRRKADYARAAAANIAVQAQALVTAWDSSFLTQLVEAGHGSTLFSTQQIAISNVAEAAFYLDIHVKDRKLAMPLGLKDCLTPTCPTAIESTWADRGKQHLRNNLAGVKLILEGCATSELGFDDLLESAGAPSLAVKMRADLAAALVAIDALPGPSLAQALASDPAKVQRVYDAIKELTDFLKLEFSTVLQIVSQRVEGDHD